MGVGSGGWGWREGVGSGGGWRWREGVRSGVEGVSKGGGKPYELTEGNRTNPYNTLNLTLLLIPAPFASWI